MTQLKFTPTHPIFPDNTIPSGFLPMVKPAQACWYYYILCEKQRVMVGKGPESQIIIVDTGYEHQTPWYDKHYWGTAKAVAMIYQIEIEEMFSYWSFVIREARRMELPSPALEYMTPKRTS